MFFSKESERNDSGPSMNAALLSSNNDILINNVMFPRFSLVFFFSSLQYSHGHFVFCSVIYIYFFVLSEEIE